MQKIIILILSIFVFSGCQEKSSNVVEKEKVETINRVLGSDLNCRPNDPDCTIVPGGITVLPFGGSGDIPACETMHISYSVQFCYIGDQVSSISVFDFTAYPLGSGGACDELNTYLYNLVYSDREAFSEALEIIAFIMSLEVEKALVISFIGNRPCSNSSLNYTHYENTCYVYNDDGTKNSCGSVCCTRESTYCLNKKGVITRTNISYDEHSGSCNALDSGGLRSDEPTECGHVCGGLLVSFPDPVDWE